MIGIRRLPKRRKCNKLETKIIDFLERHCEKEKTFLLALSGGPDSIALFHLLRGVDFSFEVAHIDHSWRPESSKEAETLQALCLKYHLTFHLHTLAPPEGGNLEDKARGERLAFFRRLCKQRELRGVFLAHHADDQAETVLKRVLEGASLPKLRGLAPVKEVQGLALHRPLLTTRKKELLEWLEKRGYHYFEDGTNRDPRFLRGRLRHEILPSLSKQFGKQVSTSLCRLGEAASELAEFLEVTLEKYRNCEGGDLSQEFPFLAKMVIRDAFQRNQIALPQSVLETIWWHLQKRGPRKTLKVGQSIVEITHGSFKINKT